MIELKDFKRKIIVCTVSKKVYFELVNYKHV